MEHPVAPAIFTDEFSEYLQGVILSKDPLLTTGDVNFHVDDYSDKDAQNSKMYYVNLDYIDMKMDRPTSLLMAAQAASTSFCVSCSFLHALPDIVLVCVP